MADVSSTLRAWSGTASSNSPSGSTNIGAGLDDNLREIQAVTKKFLAGKGTAIASAATMDLTTMDGYYASVTGNTTVTGLGTEVAGISYWLRTASTPQFTHGAAAIVLPGGANLTAAAGDILRFTSEGSGVWVMTGFLPAGITGTGSMVRATSPTVSLASASTAVTQTAGDNTTKLATTAYVDRGSSGASEVYLGTFTASNAATLDITTGFSSSYNNYRLYLEGIVPATDATSLLMRMDTNGGASFDAGATDYDTASRGLQSGGGAEDYNAATTEIRISGGTTGIGNTTSLGGVNGVLTLHNINSVSGQKCATWQAGYFASAGGAFVGMGGGVGATNSATLRDAAVNAVRFLINTGNITGTVRMYGIRKA